VKLLASGVVIGAVGAAMIVGSTHTSAEIGAGVVRVVHRIRF
jgi:hypothetical protein